MERKFTCIPRDSVSCSSSNPSFEISKEFKNNVLDALFDDFGIECTALINNLSVIFKLPTGDLHSVDTSTIVEAERDDTFDDLVDETAIHINNMCP